MAEKRAGNSNFVVYSVLAAQGFWRNGDGKYRILAAWGWPEKDFGVAGMA